LPERGFAVSCTDGGQQSALQRKQQDQQVRGNKMASDDYSEKEGHEEVTVLHGMGYAQEKSYATEPHTGDSK